MERGIGRSALRILQLRILQFMFDDFTGLLDQRWTETCIGGGTLHLAHSTLRMAFESARQGQYTDAQIDDYDNLRRAAYPWRPPLRMQVRARSSSPAATASSRQETAIRCGPAVFGFWTYQFSPHGDIFTLREVV